MASVVSNYHKLNQVLLKELKFFKHGPVERFLFSTNEQFVNKLKGRIEAAAHFLPREYRAGYTTPLLANLEKIIANMMQTDPLTGEDDPEVYIYLTLLVNAALQPAQHDMAKYLRPAQTIADELYTSYLKARRRLGVKGPLDQKIPPLVGFVRPLPRLIGYKPAPMPDALELGLLHDYVGHLAKDFKAGAVGLPAGFIDAPLLWGVLGHEVGGHYVLTSDQSDKLMAALKKKIYAKLLGEKYPTEIAALWAYWAEEAAADVCGVLNLGPSFGIGAASFYTAQLRASKQGNREKLDGVFYPKDQHPSPVLIPAMIGGAISGLKKLGLSRKWRYIAQLEEIATRYTKTDLEAVTILKDEEKKREVPTPNFKSYVKLPSTISLKKMQESARLVGYFIATVELEKLGRHHDLQDLMTWTDQDEEAAVDVADKLKTAKSATRITMNGNKMKNVHLLSGGLLAVIRQPDLYKHINKVLSSALCRK